MSDQKSDFGQSVFTVFKGTLRLKWPLQKLNPNNDSKADPDSEEQTFVDHGGCLLET